MCIRDRVPAESRAAQDKSLDVRLLRDEALRHIAALNRIAKKRGQSLAQMALAWVLRDQRVTSALIGASSVQQLEDSAAAVRHLEFTPAELKSIDRHAVDTGINLWAASSAGCDGPASGRYAVRQSRYPPAARSSVAPPTPWLHADRTAR